MYDPLIYQASTNGAMVTGLDNSTTFQAIALADSAGNWASNWSFGFRFVQKTNSLCWKTNASMCWICHTVGCIHIWSDRGSDELIFNLYSQPTSFADEVSFNEFTIVSFNNSVSLMKNLFTVFCYMDKITTIDQLPCRMLSAKPRHCFGFTLL